MIIDAFTHILPALYLNKLVSLDSSIKKRYASIERMARERPLFIDVARRIGLLEKYGIDIQLVTPIPDCNNIPVSSKETLLDLCRACNDEMAKIMDEGRGRLFGAASVPLELLEDGGLREMERAIEVLGLKAFALQSHVKGQPLDSMHFRPFWDRVAALGVPVYVHPTNPAGWGDRPYEKEYDMTHVFGWPFETTLTLSRLVFSGIMEQYPNLKIVSHHLGGGIIPFLFGRIEESYPPENQERLLGRVLSKPLKELFGRFYYDTAVGGSTAAIKCAHEVFGAENILFATDTPFGPGGGTLRLETYPSLITSMNLPEGDEKKILGENAKKLFGLA
jgi:aminocarboxymuconate-semialdehyde decarboxylase